MKTFTLRHRVLECEISESFFTQSNLYQWVQHSRVLMVVRKNRRPPFDAAQDERLITRSADKAIPFVLRHSKQERVFSRPVSPR
jgi:hypothetical protein